MILDKHQSIPLKQVVKAQRRPKLKPKDIKKGLLAHRHITSRKQSTRQSRIPRNRTIPSLRIIRSPEHINAPLGRESLTTIITKTTSPQSLTKWTSRTSSAVQRHDIPVMHNRNLGFGQPIPSIISFLFSILLHTASKLPYGTITRVAELRLPIKNHVLSFRSQNALILKWPDPDFVIVTHLSSPAIIRCRSRLKGWRSDDDCAVTQRWFAVEAP